MIGNDIVDLALAKKESNWQRKGYLNKIFAPSEQLLISASENPEIMVWNLWSRKEAVYKIYNRQTGIRAYIPLKIVCSKADSEIGIVNCYGETYFTKTKITNQYVSTVAVLHKSDFDSILVLDNNTEIKKLDGIPFVASNDKIVSISHHGNFKQIVTL